MFQVSKSMLAERAEDDLVRATSLTAGISRLATGDPAGPRNLAGHRD